MYTPVSESAVSTSSYVTAATGLEDLPSHDPTSARHVANNDPERETMLSGDHINSGQDSAGLSVSEQMVIFPGLPSRMYGVSKCW